MPFDFNKASEEVVDKINELSLGHTPNELYDPLYYILSIGGKRTRPVLTLLGCALFKDNYNDAMEPALGVEMFHNFTLMHDDIMDKAPLRRGKATVHEKWNNNIALLSGDVMLVRAYEYIAKVPANILAESLRLFSKCATEVCEGQQFDMNFEDRDNVSIEEYINMIRLKTAVLLGFSLRLGALIGGASKKDALLLKEFGENIGTGFQLKDDILDVYGDQEKFGKQVGGDIIANKKTFLLIKALEKAEGKQAETLKYWLEQKDFDNTEKVNAITKLYDELDIREEAERKMDEFFEKGFANLKAIDISEERKAPLLGFAQALYKREQ